MRQVIGLNIRSNTNRIRKSVIYEYEHKITLQSHNYQIFYLMPIQSKRFGSHLVISGCKTYIK